MENGKLSGPPDASTAAELFAQLSPERQRDILDAMRRTLARRKAAPAEMRPGA